MMFHTFIWSHLVADIGSLAGLGVGERTRDGGAVIRFRCSLLDTHYGTKEILQ